MVFREATDLLTLTILQAEENAQLSALVSIETGNYISPPLLIGLYLSCYLDYLHLRLPIDPTECRSNTEGLGPFLS